MTEVLFLSHLLLVLNLLFSSAQWWQSLLLPLPVTVLAIALEIDTPLRMCSKCGDVYSLCFHHFPVPLQADCVSPSWI